MEEFVANWFCGNTFSWNNLACFPSIKVCNCSLVLGNFELDFTSYGEITKAHLLHVLVLRNLERFLAKPGLGIISMSVRNT